MVICAIGTVDHAPSAPLVLGLMPSLESTACAMTIAGTLRLNYIHLSSSDRHAMKVAMETRTWIL